MSLNLSSKWPLLALVCMLLPAANSLAIADECGSAPLPYEANYSVSRKGNLAGSMQVVLKRTGAETYHYRMDTRVKWGIFNALIQEFSNFSWKNGIVLPNNFRLTQKVSFYKRSESVDFNWDALKATGTKKRDDFELEIQPGMQDKLTIYLLLARNLCEGNTQVDANVVSGPALKDHSYSLQAVEPLDTELGRIQTTHLRRGTADSAKQTDIWHANETHFLPVKLVYRNKDDVTIMNLTDISFDSTVNTAETP